MALVATTSHTTPVRVSNAASPFMHSSTVHLADLATALPPSNSAKGPACASEAVVPKPKPASPRHPTTSPAAPMPPNHLLLLLFMSTLLYVILLHRPTAA